MNHPELDPFVARSLRLPFDDYLMDDRRTPRGRLGRRTARTPRRNR